MQGYSYPQLYQALQDWPYKQSPAYLANLNRIIFMGELRLIRDVDFDVFDTNDSVALTANQSLIPKPAQSQSIQFTNPLSEGAISGTLNGLWGGITAAYVVTFGDGELQSVTLTSGQNTASWPQPGLANNQSSATAQVNSQFVAERSLRILYNGKPKRLIKRSYDFVQDYSSAVAGQPLYYCEIAAALSSYASQWQMAPAAGPLATALLRRYIQRPQSIVVAGNTFLGDNFGEVLFAACLMESEGFLKADDRYADMKAKYEGELLPNARGESAILTRLGMYQPMAPVASTPAPPAMPVQQQG